MLEGVDGGRVKGENALAKEDGEDEGGEGGGGIIGDEH